jgi:hypothetical protein
MASRKSAPAGTFPAIPGAEQSVKGLTAALASGSEAWIEAQTEFLQGAEEICKGWLQRRREALDAVRQSITQLRDTGDVMDLVRLQQEWTSGSMRRLSADFEALSRFALAFSQKAMTRLPDISRAIAQDTREPQKPILSAAGSKPGAQSHPA